MAIQLRTLSPNPPEHFDNSILSTFQRCPRKAFYQYYLDRAHDARNFPIQFGVAYHRFREVLELNYLDSKDSNDLSDASYREALFELAFNAALEVEGGFEDPPAEAYHSYLHQTRLLSSCEEAFDHWLGEKRTGSMEILFPEQPFELELPNDEYYTGKIDQVLEWRGRELWIRDFKTTSRMGRTYPEQFDPNNQFTGYVWAAQELSGRQVQGVIVETLYNTKTKGPEIKQFLSTRTPEQVEEWVEEVCYEIERVRQYEEDQMFPKRTLACNDYGGCLFRDACKKSHWHTREKWLESNTIESHWDPLNPEDEEGVVD